MNVMVVTPTMLICGSVNCIDRAETRRGGCMAARATLVGPPRRAQDVLAVGSTRGAMLRTLRFASVGIEAP